MKRLIPLCVCIVFVSCTPSIQAPSQDVAQAEDVKSQVYDYQSLTSLAAEAVAELPPDGTYRYEVAFAEWNGISMGEKMTVIIKGDFVQVIYEGDGKLTNTKAGEVFEEGVFRKHVSGDWIIAHTAADLQAEHGGCTGGPTIIDFRNRKYWMC